MRLYVAGRFQSYKKVRGVIDRLEVLGHTITYDWTRSQEFDEEGEPVNAPHTLPRHILSRFAMRDRQGVAEAEGIVVCADDNLAGAYIELGMALQRTCPAYVVAHDRWTIFYELPEVYLFDTYEELFAYMENHR